MAMSLSASRRIALGSAGVILLLAFGLGIARSVADTGKLPGIESLTRGRSDFAAGRLDGAAREFELAAAILPTDPAPLLALATVLEALGDASGQLEALEAASTRAPSDARVLFALGTALGRGGKHGRAMQALESSIALDPGQLDARANLAVIYLEVGQVREALSEAEYVLARNANHSVAAAVAQRARERLGSAPGTPRR